MGKEGDRDGLLLERSLFQTYIKICAFGYKEHLSNLVSCGKSGVSQEGAEVPVVLPVWTVVCSTACRLGCLQVHSSTVATPGEGGEFAVCSMVARAFDLLHALFKALKCDHGLTSLPHAKAIESGTAPWPCRKTPCKEWKEFRGGTGRKLTPGEAKALVASADICAQSSVYENSVADKALRDQGLSDCGYTMIH